MKTVTELFEGKLNDMVYYTYRGTTGDSDGTRIIDDEFIEENEYADVCKLAELKQINEDAYNDIMSYIADNAKWFDPFNIDDYFVLINDCLYILMWD
jgi:hypothetical protein